MNTHLERFAQIAEILARHGLGFLGGAMGVDRWLPGRAAAPEDEASTAVRLRLALEELGPTFIKLGQLLSTRSDVVPPAYLTELSKLQDAAPAVPAAVIRSLIEQELGKAPEQIFASFDEQPLACASIGQAHAATLDDGTRVVVKVRRPGVVARISEDLDILQNLAAYASRHWDTAADYNLTGIAGEFAETLRSELDYLLEGRNAERFSKNFAAVPDIYIPRIFWATTTSRVLTMERIEGIKVDQIQALDNAGISRGDVAEKAARAAAKMIFEDGFFHADPHPGNLFIQPGGRIALIDFGMVGEIGEELRGQLGSLLLAFTSSDPDRISSALRTISVTRPTADRAALRQDLIRFIQLYKGRRLAEVQIAPIVTQMLAILREHRLQLPREMAMLMKMVLMTEGMGVRLDPEFSLGEVLRPYARRLAQERFSARNLAGWLRKAGLEAADLGTMLPEQLRMIMENLDGGIEVHLRTAELDPLVGRVERIGNRLVAGMIAAAFIRGIGDLTTADRDRLRDWGNPLLGAGLGAAGSLAAYLAMTARRQKQRNTR